MIQEEIRAGVEEARYSRAQRMQQQGAWEEPDDQKIMWTELW